tara:strand:+ start:30139 stop:30264 length:126 start_codon:yes stop_codon:yes gene_type:complete
MIFLPIEQKTNMKLILNNLRDLLKSYKKILQSFKPCRIYND